MKIKRSNEDLIRSLGRNLKFLKNLIEVYHQDKDAAVLIAVVLRVLLHDGQKGSKSISLLTQLNIKDIEFISTADIWNTDNLYDSYHGLVTMSPSSDGLFVPKFVAEINDFRLVTFNEYWNQVVIHDDNNETFTREFLVKTLADQDGGAHEDLYLPKDYFDLSRNGTTGWKDEYGNAVTRIELPTVIQIAYEVLNSVKPVYTSLVNR